MEAAAAVTPDCHHVLADGVDHVSAQRSRWGHEGREILGIDGRYGQRDEQRKRGHLDEHKQVLNRALSFVPRISRACHQKRDAHGGQVDQAWGAIERAAAEPLGDVDAKISSINRTHVARPSDRNG
jgi:hypothetical protein